jgi:hypothetical protein
VGPTATRERAAFQRTSARAQHQPRAARPPPAPPTPNLQRAGAASRRDAAPVDPPAATWPAALLQHPSVCEDPAVLLRLLATGRALGDAAAAAAAGRLRLALGREGQYASNLREEGSFNDFFDDEACYDDGGGGSGSREPDTRLSREECQRLCREQAAFVERRAALLAELAVADASVWHSPSPLRSDHKDRPVERVLAPALQRAAAAGRLGGLRVVEVPGCRLQGGLLDALALCPALTRLRLGTFGQQDNVYDSCVYIGGGRPSADKRRAFGGRAARPEGAGPRVWLRAPGRAGAGGPLGADAADGPATDSRRPPRVGHQHWEAGH